MTFIIYKSAPSKPLFSKAEMMPKRKWIPIVVGILALAGGARGIAIRTGAESSPAAASLPVPQAVRVQEIRTEAATNGQSYTGVVRARYETDLAFRVGGKIVSRHVEVGQRVTAGTLLFRLDPTDYRLALKAAEADLSAAEAEVVQATSEYDRNQQLIRRDAISASELAKSRSAYGVAIGRRDRAKELLTLARNHLAYCELTTDADGVVTALSAEAGQVVSEGQITARLARDGEREVVVSLPENRATAAKTAVATVTLWAAPGEPHAAVLRELSPIADSVTRTYQARFTIEKPGPEAALGMTATIHLAPADSATGFVLPLSSLHRQSDRPAVWVVGRGTGRPTLTPVEVREYRQESVVVADGLKAGDLVVTAGVQKIDPGTVVRPWEQVR
jgi:multidrug efflux system membrane fusion protein